MNLGNGREENHKTGGDAAGDKAPRRLEWFEWVWSALPLLLVIQGGVLGGLCGLIAFALNLRQFRTHASRVYHFMVTTLISIGAVTIEFILRVVIALVLSGY